MKTVTIYITNKLIIASLFLIAISLLGISTSYAEGKVVRCGREWINIHKNNPELIGIYVQQYPDSVPDRQDYEGRHPAMLIFVFRNNKKHVVTYSPSGQVQNGVWGDLPKDHWVYGVMQRDFKLNVECNYSVSK